MRKFAFTLAALGAMAVALPSIASAGLWLVSLVVLGSGFYLGLLFQVGLFLGIAYQRARESLTEERKQWKRIREDEERREAAYRDRRIP